MADASPNEVAILEGVPMTKAPRTLPGYALEEWCASRKFRPNYVKFRTPQTSIRRTTFACGETEVKVIDPNKLEVVEAFGCKVRGCDRHASR
jgi:hypothetical protein